VSYISISVCGSRYSSRFAELPRYPDLPHFKKGFTSLKWRSGSDNKTIALVRFLSHLDHISLLPFQLLTPVLDAVLPSKLNKRRSILQLFRLLGEFAILIRFTQHTDVTLERMRGVLDRMSHLQEVSTILVGFEINSCFSGTGRDV